MKCRRGGRFLSIVSLVVVSASGRAWADVSPADAAAAEALFQEGKKLMGEGKFPEACERFTASRRLDPGIGTSLNLGDCLEKVGRTASAYGVFNETAVEARRIGDKLGRDAEAAARAKALEPRLSKLRVEVSAGHRVPGLTLRRDGQALAEELWGLEVPVDPGDHAVEASAPGRSVWKVTVQVKGEPGVTMVDVPELAVAPVESKGDVAAPSGGWSGQKTAGVVVAGVGVVGIALGTVFGVQVLSKNSEAAKYCRADDPYLCSAQGVELRKAMKTPGTVSDVMFAVGGAALVGGAVLFFTAKPGAGAGAGSSGVAGRWMAAPMVAGDGSGGGVLLRTRW